MSNGPGKRLRLSLVITRPMRIALECLSDREGVALATMATRVLRTGLDRTIQSAAVQDRLRQHNAQRTHAAWVEESMTEHLIEKDYAETAATTPPPPGATSGAFTANER